jgi:hypothetical protein
MEDHFAIREVAWFQVCRQAREIDAVEAGEHVDAREKVHMGETQHVGAVWFGARRHGS